MVGPGLRDDQAVAHYADRCRAGCGSPACGIDRCVDRLYDFADSAGMEGRVEFIEDRRGFPMLADAGGNLSLGERSPRRTEDGVVLQPQPRDTGIQMPLLVR